MKILETRDLKKYYGNGDIQVKALDGVNLAIEEGEFAAVVGTSGSGEIHAAAHAGRAGLCHRRYGHGSREEDLRVE